MKRSMTVKFFSCCDKVIISSFIAYIGYQKETKSQVNPLVTLSQVNNTEVESKVVNSCHLCYSLPVKSVFMFDHFTVLDIGLEK